MPRGTRSNGLRAKSPSAGIIPVQGGRRKQSIAIDYGTERLKQTSNGPAHFAWAFFPDKRPAPVVGRLR